MEHALKKALLLLDQHPSIKAHDHRLSDIREQTRERLKFIQKQVDDAKDNFNKESQKIWDDIKAELKADGFLDSYNEEKQFLEIDTDAGALYICDKKDREMSPVDLLRKLFE